MKKNIYSFLLFPVVAFFIYRLTVVPDNSLYFITNLLILFFSYIGMMLDSDKNFTLSKIVFIFVFFFFGIVPLNDNLNGNLYWGGQEIDDFYKIITNIFIIFGILAFFVGSKIKLIFFDRIISSLPNIRKINLFFFILLFSIVSFIILYVKDFDLLRLLFRGTSSDLVADSHVKLSQLEYLLFDNFIRPMPINLLIILLFFHQNNKQVCSNFDRLKSRMLLIVFFIAAFLLVSPTSIPRFQAAALYIPLIIIFTNLWDRPYGMQLTILGGLLLVIPFLDKFREYNQETFEWSINLNFLNHGHFDAYQNFVRAIEVDFFSEGRQLLGSLLFFIPRSFWEEKPIGSGHALADLAGYNFSNISMPFIAEGYINFGFIGIPIFMLLLGLILGNLDRIAWSMKKNHIFNLFIYYYYLLFGMIFFIMRGDLMSSFAYIVGFTASFWFLVTLLKYVGIGYRIRV